jgi:hypothetical protein
MAEVREFRTRLPLRIAVLVAAVLWAAVLALLLAAPETAEPHALLGAAAFLAFFACFGWIYGRTWIRVTPGGLVSRTPFRVQPVPFSEIERIVVQDGPAGRVYAVFTRRGLIRFTSLFDHHRELFETLRERAGLVPV